MTPPRHSRLTGPSEPSAAERPTATPLALRPRRGRGRRPIAEVRADILSAAADILLSRGMTAFTIEGVAARAGASKTTIYKWWRSKGALALDAFFHAVEDTLAFPDTGDIASDLLTQIRAFIHLVTDTPAGRILAELIGQAQTDPELAAALRIHYSGPRSALAVGALRRAQARGQVRAEVDPEVVVNQLWGACYHRLLMLDLPLDESFATALVDNLVVGLRPR